MEIVSVFIALWVKNASLELIKHETRISQKTAVDWSSFAREVVFDYMFNNRQQMGGPGRTVEIDESKYGRRKYNRGKRVEGQWVFGLIERETGNCVLVPVEKRDAATLVPIITKFVKAGMVKIRPSRPGIRSFLKEEMP